MSHARVQNALFLNNAAENLVDDSLHLQDRPACQAAFLADENVSQDTVTLQYLVGDAEGLQDLFVPLQEFLAEVHRLETSPGASPLPAL